MPRNTTEDGEEMKIEGKGRVWAKEHDGCTSYTMGISSKDQDGKWVNAYQPVRFRKGERVESGTDIDFVAFPTVMKGKQYNSVLWQITEYRIDADTTARPVEDNFSALTENDIPF